MRHRLLIVLDVLLCLAAVLVPVYAQTETTTVYYISAQRPPLRFNISNAQVSIIPLEAPGNGSITLRIVYMCQYIVNESCPGLNVYIYDNDTLVGKEINMVCTPVNGSPYCVYADTETYQTKTGLLRFKVVNPSTNETYWGVIVVPTVVPPRSLSDFVVALITAGLLMGLIARGSIKMIAAGMLAAGIIAGLLTIWFPGSSIHIGVLSPLLVILAILLLVLS